MRTIARRKFFKQSCSWEDFKVRNVLILDYGITTMFANNQWSVSRIKIAHAV